MIPTQSFPSVTSINSWSKSIVKYVGGHPEFPYVLKDGLYYYFAKGTVAKETQKINPNYGLVMTSTFDLMEKKI